MGTEQVEVECKIERETDMAMLVTSTDTGVREWIPLSQVHRITRDPRTGLATIYMAEWLATKKGLV